MKPEQIALHRAAEGGINEMLRLALEAGVSQGQTAATMFSMMAQLLVDNGVPAKVVYQLAEQGISKSKGASAIGEGGTA